MAGVHVCTHFSSAKRLSRWVSVFNRDERVRITTLGTNVHDPCSCPTQPQALSYSPWLQGAPPTCGRERSWWSPRGMWDTGCAGFVPPSWLWSPPAPATPYRPRPGTGIQQVLHHRIEYLKELWWERGTGGRTSVSIRPKDMGPERRREDFKAFPLVSRYLVAGWREHKDVSCGLIHSLL